MGIKSEICKKCKFDKTCESLPGFCLLLPYAGIAAVLVLVIYFVVNDHL